MNEPSLPPTLLSTIPELAAIRLRQRGREEVHEKGEVLVERGDASRAFFVEEGRIGLLHAVTGMEAAVIGPEGLVGHTVLLAGAPMPFRAVTNTEVRVLRVSRADLMVAMSDQHTRSALMMSTISLIDQLAENIAVANLSVKQRVAQWLLRTSDLTGDVIRVTHEDLSRRLCVRRPGVTVAIHELEGDHLIRNRRGSITVADREGLRSVIKFPGAHRDAPRRQAGPPTFRSVAPGM